MEPTTSHDAVEAVGALYRRGELEPALALATGLLTHHRFAPEQLARLQVLRASLLFTTGHVAAALRAAQWARSAPGAAADDVADADGIRLLIWEAQDCVPELRAHAADILAGTAAQTDGGLAGALTAFGWIAWKEGRVANAIGLLRAGAKRSESGPHGRRRPHPQLLLARLYIGLGEDEHAAAWIERARRHIDSAGDVEWSVAASIHDARRHCAAGRLDHATRGARDSLASALRLGAYLWVPLALATLKAVAIARGEPARTAARSPAWDPTAGGEPVRIGVGTGLCALMNARICAMRGDPKRAVTAARQIYDDPNAHKQLFIEEPAAAPDLVRLALASGEPSNAAAIVSCATQLAADNAAFDSVATSAQHARGLLDDDVALLKRAVAGHRQPFVGVAALLDLAGALLDRGECAVAQPLYQRATTALTQMGGRCATATVETQASVQARTSLRPACRKSRGDVDGPAVGWPSLSKIERTIAELVATGLSNRQVGEHTYMSRHTVDFHLRRVYRKLNVASRVQLARLVVETSTA
jgi:DNA-binding CsgD family transcriptional regulator